MYIVSLKKNAEIATLKTTRAEFITQNGGGNIAQAIAFFDKKNGTQSLGVYSAEMAAEMANSLSNGKAELKLKSVLKSLEF